MPASVVGRDAELATISDFLAGIPAGAAALVLEGEAGMGKTTLFDSCIERAREQGLRVLVARPAESENDLSFAGLGDLLTGQLDHVFASLPSAQQRALARALVLDDDDEAAVDPRAVGVAVQSALRALADGSPTLVAIDDAQWLDDASVGALSFACRRLREEPAGVLLARRSGLPSGLVDELRRSLGVEAVEVGPLDVVALHRLLQDRLGALLPRPLLAEVCDASGGNPFYAIEIVRTLQRRGTTVEAGQPLPVPDSLHELLDERLGSLSDECRDFLLAAAAHAHPTVAITEAATDVAAKDGLRPALEAGIVELDGSRIRFTHPLLAAGALELADPQRRVEIHVRLAELLDDPEARAWQLAAAVDAPDEAVASAIEDAAGYARRRGAPRPAALLLDCAERLTPALDRDDAVRRAVDAAYLHFEAGDARRAEEKLREIVIPLGPGPLRARALATLARVRLYERPDEARVLFMQVIDEAGSDRATLAVAHEGVGASSIWMFEGFEEALNHTTKALALATELGDHALAADAILTHLTAETLLGHPTDETCERALALQSSAEHLRVMDQPLISLAEHWSWTDSHEQARAALLDLMRRAQDLGDENSRPWLLYLLGDVERLLGNLETSLALAREGQGASEQSGQALFASSHLALECLVFAGLGRVDESREAAERACTGGTDRFVRLVTSAGLGHLALTLRELDEVVDQLQPSLAFLGEERVVEPGVARFAPDLFEALLELGRRDEAVEVLEWYEGNARRLERVSALANSARGRGLLAAQAGDLDSALVGFKEALEWHAQVELPVDRGRTLLALGAAQRRLKRRREARETLEEALSVFEGIGAALWAERARSELRRISGRAATPGALTPAEERVAALVAEGKTNKEVAAALFLSDRTVEGHLARIFGKLGIRHRTELSGALQTQGIALPNTGDTPVSAGPSAP
jgi:DNA-binding CsgD family transcriptional regulator